MARQPGTGAPGADSGAREDRFEAMLEERFSPEARRAFARELAEHDRRRGPGGLELGRVQRSLVFRGDVPEKVRGLLSQWLPGLVAHAEARGLRLRDPYQRIAVYTRAAFESEQGPIPSSLSLPASSYGHDALNRRYTVRLVLPERLGSIEALLTAVRAVLTRLYGDIFLAEEVRPLEPWRETAEAAEADAVSVGLAEKLRLLPELPHTSGELEQAIAAFARSAGINLKRQPDQARKGLLRELAQRHEAQKLTAAEERMLDEAFAPFVEALRADPAAGVEETAAAVEAADRQLHFLPPDEQPEYERLREQNPAHYLRAAKLRLEFLVEALGGVSEDFETLDGGGPASPLMEERLAGYLEHLEREGLARPYLVPGVRLSEELERRRGAFPLEVHGILQRFPAPDNPEKAFRTLSRRLENALHQRLYNAVIVLRHWLRLADTGRGRAFAGGEQHRTLKGLVANFRLRRPLLESLATRVGVVLDVAERQSHALPGRERHEPFPFEAFARAWGPFVAHALLADFLQARGLLRGFDAGRYWAGVEARLHEQIDAGSTQAALVHLLRRTCASGGDEKGLPLLVESLRQGSGTFRFAVTRAAKPRPQEMGGEAWREQLDEWAQAVLRAGEARRQHAIVAADGDPGFRDPPGTARG